MKRFGHIYLSLVNLRFRLILFILLFRLNPSFDSGRRLKHKDEDVERGGDGQASLRFRGGGGGGFRAFRP